MGTHAAIYIQDDDSTEWHEIFSHYDGYPSHLLPALAKADPEALKAKGTIAGLEPDGTIHPTASGRNEPPKRVAAPTLPSWASHAYILTIDGWKHAASSEEAARAAAC